MELVKNSLYNDATLLAYYPLTGNSTDVKSAHNGSDTDITYGTSYGKYGQGALFNGTSSKIAITDHADFRPTTNFTIGAWVKADSTGADEDEIFTCYARPDLAQEHGWLLYISGLYYFVNHTTYDSVGTGVDIRDDLWHMIVATKEGTGTNKLKVYLDGVFKNQANTTGDVLYDTTNYVRIGDRNFGGSEDSFWKGCIDEVFIFNNKVLTASEIQGLYLDGAGFLLNFI
jgi:hypothetical protein